ncbi:MAG: SelL-related redox protein [Myxococcota bacterium]
MRVATKLKPIEVRDPAGKAVRLGDLWREKTVVLAFVRHFGCLFCREQVGRLHGELKAIRERGAELVVVGNGRPEQARDFKKKQKITFPLFTDPTLKAYQAAGLRRGLISTLGPRTMLHGARALGGGNVATAILGDPWQQGGVFVITPRDKVLFAQQSKEAGDHADPADILAALEKPGRVRRKPKN